MFGDTRQEQKMAQVRDMVVTGCFAALRYSDLMALKWSNVTEKGGKFWFELQSRKTGTLSKILLPGFLVETLSTYRRLRRSNIFPPISNGYLNKLIK